MIVASLKLILLDVKTVWRMSEIKKPPKTSTIIVHNNSHIMQYGT